MNTASKILLVALALNCSSLAIAVEYTFSQVYTGPAQPGVAINDNGLVALIHDDVSNPGTPTTGWLITSDGHTVTQISFIGGLANLHQALSLNNNGFVAFREGVSGGAVFSSNGTTKYTIAADTYNGGLFPYISRTALSINDTGTVAFSARQLGDSLSHVFVGDGLGAPIKLNDRNGVVPTINSASTVAYRYYDPGSNYYSIEIQKETQLYSLPDVNAAHLPDINDFGEAAFFGSVNGAIKVVVWDGESSPTFIDGSLYEHLSLGFTYDGGAPDCAINNQGLVAFGASTTSMNPYNQGIFTGPDPVADKVIQAGDLLDGVAIENLGFSRNGLNNLGQIAFSAYMNDGTTGVWVATPVPEPSTLILLAIGAIGLLAYVWRRRVSR